MNEDTKQKILDKKELKGIPEEFMDKFIEEYKAKNSKAFKILEEKNFNDKSREFDELKKFIRKRLREVHGVFAKKPLGDIKKNNLLSELHIADATQRSEILNQILSSHQSTSERMLSYEELYRRLFAKQLPARIIDLGCGYNPFSYHLILNYRNMHFLAIDINSRDSDFIQQYFNDEKIKGKAITMDLSAKESLAFIEKESVNSDVCFAFKLLDSLEAKKRGSSKELLNSIHSTRIIISFPKKTISGKGEIRGKRNWFRRIVDENFEIDDEFELSDEKYFCLKRKNSTP